MDTSEIMIKSKERVKQHGEVFTGEETVKDMMNITEDFRKESYVIGSTWLEPSCGNGNFLVEILKRKLESAAYLHDNGENYDLNAIRAVSAVYGVDIQFDNVLESQERMIELFKEMYAEHMKAEPNKNIMDCVRAIISINIMLGNTLISKMLKMKNWRRNCGKTTVGTRAFEGDALALMDGDQSKAKTVDMQTVRFVFNGDMVTVNTSGLMDTVEIPMGFKAVKYDKVYQLVDKLYEDEDEDI